MLSSTSSTFQSLIMLREGCRRRRKRDVAASACAGRPAHSFITSISRRFDGLALILPLAQRGAVRLYGL
jgi:hypothetical protein